MALRYAELNPVRAGLVNKAELWPWSTAAAHCKEEADAILEIDGDMGQALVNGGVAGISGPRGNTGGHHGDTQVHAHGPSARHGRVPPAVGGSYPAASAPQKGGRGSPVAGDARQKALAFEKSP